MIKSSALKKVRLYTFCKDSTDINQQSLHATLERKALENQVPVVIDNEQIKFGGAISPNVVDCLVLYHPEHPKDFFRHVISLNQQEDEVHVSVNYYGRSKQTGKDAWVEEAKGSLRKGDTGKALLKGIMALGKSNNKMQNEYDYYYDIREVINGVLTDKCWEVSI